MCGGWEPTLPQELNPLIRELLRRIETFAEANAHLMDARDVADHNLAGFLRRAWACVPIMAELKYRPELAQGALQPLLPVPFLAYND